MVFKPYIAHKTGAFSIYSWHTLGLLHMIANLVSGMHIKVYTYCHVMGTYMYIIYNIIYICCIYIYRTELSLINW